MKHEIRKKRNVSLIAMAVTLVGVWLCTPSGNVALAAFLATICIGSGCSAGLSQFQLQRKHEP